MTTFTALTYSIVRLDEQAQTRTLVGVGSGVVNVDEMSWDERLLATSTTWRRHATPGRYQPSTDVIHFNVHADDGTFTGWVGDGVFPINLTSLGDVTAD